MALACAPVTVAAKGGTYSSSSMPLAAALLIQRGYWLTNSRVAILARRLRPDVVHVERCTYSFDGATDDLYQSGIYLSEIGIGNRVYSAPQYGEAGHSHIRSPGLIRAGLFLAVQDWGARVSVVSGMQADEVENWRTIDIADAPKFETLGPFSPSLSQRVSYKRRMLH